MNAKLVKPLVAGVLVLFVAAQLVLAVLSGPRFFRDDRFGYDLRLRRNEVRCAHLGVNSFRIWNRETTQPGFAPLRRPDKADVPGAPGDAVVHAYPPWHHAFFCFYGWLPEVLCLALMSAVFGACLLFIAGECRRLLAARFAVDGLAALFALSTIAYATLSCFAVLNYGVLVLAAFLLMNRALEKDLEVAAGLCWAVMMVKPQVGLLFVWPLFWHRRYRTILVAAAACLAATCVTAALVHESPLALVLQIPQIGSPYKSGGIARIAGEPFFGRHAASVVMAAFFVLTGIATGLFRKNRDFLVCCVPVVLAIPVWSYNKTHDLVILLPAFVVLAGLMFSEKKFGKWAWIGCAGCLTALLVDLWTALAEMKVIDETGREGIRAALKLLALAPLFAFLVCLVGAEFKKTRLPSQSA